MSTYASVLPPPTTEVIRHEVEASCIEETFSVQVSIATIPEGTIIGTGPWKTRRESVAEVRLEGSGIVAMHYDVDEYGIGQSTREALADLLVSLVDYRSSLEKREKRLAAKEQADLALLRVLLQR